MERKSYPRNKLSLMLMVGAFFVLVTMQAEDPLLDDKKLLLPPSSIDDLKTTLPWHTDINFRIQKSPKIPGAGIAKYALKRASCPLMCSFFCFGSGGIGWFSICAASCLITCFGQRPSDVTTYLIIHDCTFGCANGLTTAYGIDLNREGQYVENCYKVGNSYR